MNIYDLNDIEKVKLCLKALHKLYLQNEGSTQEADQLRNAIQECWTNLSSEEVEEANQLAGELHEERLGGKLEMGDE